MLRAMTSGNWRRAAREPRWRALAGAFVTVILAQGLSNSFPVFLLPISDDLGGLRSLSAAVYSVHNLVMGLVGTVVVLILFAILGAAIYRVVVAQEDLFHRVLAGTIMVWLLGQATVNMAVVTGLVPVIGVPLPFISYGGSALLMSLCAIGVVLSLARVQMAPNLRPRKLLGPLRKPGRKKPRTKA